MRILHTSDWHLGKRLFKLDRGPEHQGFLNWLLSTLIEQKIDILLMAGDVFDTPTPPHSALEMFYNFLHRVSAETKTDTYIIAGNHDSGILLEAPSKLLAFHRVKVWGRLSPDPKAHLVTLEKGQETLELTALPFFRSYELMPQGEGDALLALKKYLGERTTHPRLLMLHHLAGIFEAAGSEHVIGLSGVESIPIELLAAFDYVALGHIHKPQRIGARGRYSGSPLPLRFSETKEKSVVLIDVKDGKLTEELVPIPLMRPLITLKLTEENWMEKINTLTSSSPLTPMVEVQLSLNSPRMGIIEEIKSALLEKGTELLSFIPDYLGEERPGQKSTKLFELGPLELFKEFYASKFPLEPEVPEDLQNDFSSLLEKVKNAPETTQD